MLIRKAKRILAGVCVALMLTQSVGEYALTAVAAEGNVEDTARTEGYEEAVDVAAPVFEANAEDDAMAVEGDAVVVEDTAVGRDLYNAPVLPSQDGADISMGHDVTVHVQKEGNDYVGLITVDRGDGVEDVGRIDNNGVVTIDKSFNVIYSELFEGWLDMTELRFEEGAIVKSIGTGSFQGCKNLKTVDFSHCPALTQIGAKAFYECTSLSEVTFHDNLQTIYARAFEKCALTSVTLVPGLIGLDEYAFRGCASLESVKLEAANLVCDMAGGIFADCNIKKIDFAIRNVAGDNSKNNIIVPSSMFKGARFAEDAEILIPCEIQEIGDSAFANSNLTKVILENTPDRPSALSTIGTSAFSSTNITSITFPNTVQSLKASSFANCAGLTRLELPDSINELGARAFQNCKNISELKLPNATTTVGDYVFENCMALTEVTLPDGLTFTGKGEFKNCTGLSSVSIPDTMETIGDETFLQCSALRKVELPDSVTILGKRSFEQCTNLKEIRYSESLLEIRDQAFKNDRVLISNVFPETLTKIGASAFENCEMFKNLTIPVNVTSIGGKAFANCDGINYLTIQSNQITSCGAGIFDECLLREVYFPEGIEVIPASLFSQANFATDSIMTIPNTVTTIGDSAFAGTNSNQVNVSRIQFQEGSKLTKIGASAFAYCVALEEFSIPETTEEIGANAFANCSKISSIVIPENVTKIGAGAFANCEILSEITYNAIRVTTSNQNIFAKCNVRKILIGDKVSAFPANLFRGAQFSTNSATGEMEMITIYMPASVVEIGDYALPNIANLQRVVFAQGSALTTIGQYAFWQCVNLESINLPDSVTSIGNFAFDGCTKLGSDSTVPFSIPKSLTKLGNNAFSECPAITTVVIPEGVEKINDKAFMNDTGLTSVLMTGGSLREIGVSAFEGCNALTEVSIPNGVTKIGATAFKNCSALTKVVIPATVTTIGKDAFLGCGNVQFFVVPGSYAEKWLEDNGLTSSKLLTITYVLNGGANAPENPLGYEAGDIFIFKPATCKGYEFKGWYLDENFQTEITSLEGCTGNITLYAKWEIARYTITYELDGGVNHRDNPAFYTILDKITLKEATKEGFTFDGWYTTDPKNPAEWNSRSKVTAINAGNFGDKILYAKWDGGTAEAPTASIADDSTVKAGVKLFLTSATPGVSIYYTLDGTEPTTASARYSGGIVIDRNLTVKAIAVKSNGVQSTVAVFTYRIVDETSFWGDIRTEDQAPYGTDASKVPEGIWVAGVKDMEYTGQKITFDDLRVYDHKTLLQEKTDYTVKYANNTKAAKSDIGKKAPSVTITSKGNYKGKVVVYFTIERLSIAGEAFTAEDMAGNVTGKAQKPVPVLYYGKTKLKNKKDYSIEYFKVENGSETLVSGCESKGQYKVKLTGQGNFTGEKTVRFDLGEGTSVAKAKIKGLAACNYTGSEITQDFTVQIGSDILNKGTDYDVVYSNNVNAGTATVKIVGKGNYCGMKKATFKIKPITTLNKASFTLDKTKVEYTGIAYEIGKGIEVTATFNGKPLVKDVDYTCTYKKNTDAGTATITFTGKGGYSGTAKKTFKIESASIALLAPAFLDREGNIKTDAVYAYEQGGVKPSVQLTYLGQVLVAGKDYTVSCKNNTAKGNNAAEITIKGKKNFKGTISRKFTITPQSVAELSVSATDVPYQKKAGVLTAAKTTTVTDANGKTLVEGTDYRVSYSYLNNTILEDKDGTARKAKEGVKNTDIIPEGTIIVVKVAGNGNYNGNMETAIKICKKSIASAKVTVKPQIYTGSEVQPGADQMTVKVGRDTLVPGEDYEIVGYSNNVKKGTAKVTIHGINGYGGTKTVNFKITQKNFVLAILEKMF